MNQMQKKFFAITCLVFAGQVLAESTTTKRDATPYYRVRSQGTNIVRETAGWEALTNRCCEDKLNGAWAVVLDYSQSFRSQDICECLFGQDFGCNDDCGCNIVVAGSCADNRDTDNGFLADNFGLPVDFRSTLNFRPRIRNFVADLEFYLGLDEWAEGLYFRAHLPITNTRWDLRFCETVNESGVANADPGYYNAAGVANSDLLDKATEFFNGRGAPDLGDNVKFHKLACGKFMDDCDPCSSKSETALADLELALGYNFLCNEDYTFGLSLRTAAPTGTRPCGEYFFEPIVGNGHHWELGAGVNFRAGLWNGCDSESSFSLYVDANITHLFDTCQTRCFDLCANGANSRYMLAQKLKKNGTDLHGQTDESVVGEAGTGTITASNDVFDNEFAPVANLTKSNVDVGISVQGDVAVKFVYANECGFSWGLGYNFWGSATEDICRKKGCNNVDLSDWALKGDASVYGFLADSTAVALAATQSDAKIGQGSNIKAAKCAAAAADIAAQSANPGIDKKQFALNAAASAATNIVYSNPGGPDDDNTQTRTSIQAVRLSDKDINFTRTRGVSHKIFTHFNWSWTDCEDWTPFVGVGASAEFSPSSSCSTSCDTDCNTSCSKSSSCCDDTNGSSVRCALNQ